MRAAVQKVEKRDYTWIIVLVLIAIPLIVEFLAGEEIYNKSYDSIINAQEFMVDNFKLKLFEYIEINLTDSGSSTNNTEMNNNFYSFLDENNKYKESEKGGTKDILTSEIIHLINTNIFYLILCAILFNFINMYKIFILSMTVFSANFISSTLSYIFHSPKPYMAYYKIKSGVAFNEWSSPNNQIVVLVSFGLSLYKVLVSNKPMENYVKKIMVKNIINYIICLLFFY